MPKKTEDEEKSTYSDADTAEILERLRLGCPRIAKLVIENEIAVIDVPPFQSLPNDSLRQRSIAAETGLSGTELATLNYLLATDEKIKAITGGVELTLKTQPV